MALAGEPAAVGPSRRVLLAASAAGLPLLLAACKGVQALGTPPPPPADIQALRAAITAEKVIVARYADAVPMLRRRLHAGTAREAAGLQAVLTVQAEHTAHLIELKSRLVEPTGVEPRASLPIISPQDSVSGQFRALEAAERAASDRLLAGLAGLPPALAQLFASIAAAEASHVPYLRAGRQGR